MFERSSKFVACIAGDDIAIYAETGEELARLHGLRNIFPLNI